MPISFIPLGLLGLVMGLSWYDYQYQRIPNAVTLPLLAVFILLNWPGTPETWLGCLLLFLGWRGGAMGGGDAKLWMALLWAVSPELGKDAFWVMAGSFVITSAAQIVWRRFRQQDLTGKRAPAAWRTLPYVVWMILA